MSMQGPGQEPPEREHGPRTRPAWNRRVTVGLAGAALVLTVPAVATAATASGHQATPARPPIPPRPQASSPSEPLPPPPQMRDLDFMLGSFKCLDTPSTGQAPFYDYIVTKRAVGGHFYASDMWTPGVIRSQRTWGWDPVNRKLISQYRDDWGVMATSTSPGLVDGKIVSSGPVTLVIQPSATGEAQGIDATVSEETKPVGKGHFTDVQSTTFTGGYVVTHTLDCHRR